MLSESVLSSLVCVFVTNAAYMILVVLFCLSVPWVCPQSTGGIQTLYII